MQAPARNAPNAWGNKGYGDTSAARGAREKAVVRVPSHDLTRSYRATLRGACAAVPLIDLVIRLVSGRCPYQAGPFSARLHIRLFSGWCLYTKGIRGYKPPYLTGPTLTGHSGRAAAAREGKRPHGSYPDTGG